MQVAAAEASVHGCSRGSKLSVMAVFGWLLVRSPGTSWLHFLSKQGRSEADEAPCCLQQLQLQQHAHVTCLRPCRRGTCAAGHGSCAWLQCVQPRFLLKASS